MKNKVLVELLIPEIEEKYDIFIPINITIENLINLITKSIKEIMGNIDENDSNISLYSGETGKEYDINQSIRETDIRNGSKIILM